MAMAAPATAQLADTPWAMFHHDLNHTGLSPYYGPDTSTVKWTFSTGDKIHGSAAIAEDRTIYVGTRDYCSLTRSRLYAINPDGTEKWHWSPPRYPGSWLVDYIDSTPAIASDGTIYIGCWNRRLYALYPNGTMKWEFYDSNWKKRKGFVLTSPAIASGGIVYIGNNNGKLYAINPDGSLKWSYQTGKAIQSSPAVGSDGTVYVGSYDRNLYAINPDGSLKWKYFMGLIRSSPAIGSDGTVYVGSYDKNLYAINPDGSLKWKYPTGGWVVSSPAIGSDGTIYVGSHDKKLYAINPDGSLKWSYNTGCCITSSPAIDAYGTIYTGSADKHIYAINPDGSLLWNCNTGNGIYHSSLAIASDGTVYMGNNGGMLYAFGPGTPPNRPPVLDPIGLRTAYEAAELNITITASDPDGDSLTFSSNATFGTLTPINSTATYWSWTPDYDDAGIYWVDFGVSDGEFSDNETVTITVEDVNRPPELEEIGNQMVEGNETLTIDVNATDLDGDALIYSCNRTDLFTNFNPTTGTGSWTTGYADAGIYLVDFGVSDEKGGIDNETVSITVKDVNRPPELERIGDRSVNESELLEFTVNATDHDGDDLAYSASNLPEGASFDPATQIFSWNPSLEQDGLYRDVHFEVSDGDLIGWENITIRVGDMGGPNSPPIFEPIGDKSANENELLEFTVNVTDPDGDNLAYSASNLPDGATFNNATRTVSWTPTFEQAGTYPGVHFEVSDGELTNWTSITITVNDTNRPPGLEEMMDQSVNETETLTVDVNATDPDGDVLIYSCNRTDLFTDFNLLTGTGSWTTDYYDAGIYCVDFGISDGKGGIDNETVTITVEDVNRLPELDGIGDKSVNESGLLEFTVNATDPDGDELTYSVSNLPSGATFNSTTREFTWIPAFGQAGVYHDVSFEVTDGESIDFENITITVTGVSIEISVLPADMTVSPQDQFDVRIHIDPNGLPVYAVQYHLAYNTSVVRAETQVKGLFLGGTHDTIIVVNDIDQPNGEIAYAETRKIPDGVDVEENITRIHFIAIGPRSATTSPTLYDILVSDIDGNRMSYTVRNGTVELTENIPPVPIGISKHRINNVAKKYQSTAVLCSCSYDPDYGGEGGNITYIRWAFGDGQYGTTEGLPVDNCTCNEHKYESWQWDPLGVPPDPNNPEEGGNYMPFDVQLEVTDDGCPELTNTTNFTIDVYIAGDANGDGEVNILDAVWVGKHWRATCGTTGPCENCEGYLWDGEQKDGTDLNNDCEINILDAVIIGANWRHTAW